MKIKAENKALRQQAGYTLIELSITVAIIAVLVMTGLYGVPKILATNNVSTMSKQVALATANYSKMASMSGTSARTFSDTTVATGIADVGALGIWPAEAMTLNASGVVTAIKHPFGGAIDSKSNLNTQTNVAADGGYWIRFKGIPLAQCFDVGASLMSQAVSIYIADNAESAYNEPAKTAVDNTTYSPKVPGAAGDLKILAAGCTKPNNTAVSTTGSTAGLRNIYALYAY